MWSVVLKILSILGIILLILLGIALAALLLVLFMPVVYRGSGSAHAGEYRGCFRFRWLFGLLRGEFAYPEDGVLWVKVLWLTVYDSGGKSPDAGADEDTAQASEPAIDTETAKNADIEKASQDVVKTEEAPIAPQDEAESAEASQSASKSPQDRTEGKERKPGRKTLEGLSAKLSALKEKLQPYLAIVRDEDNQAVVRHVLGRLGKVLKSIRPRTLRLEATIGLGEPDTTGYVYGACWAVKPFLGRKCRIAITPDFERQILEGEIFLRGHIMGAVLLHHVIRVILDRRLWQLVDRLKKIPDDIKK